MCIVNSRHGSPAADLPGRLGSETRRAVGLCRGRGSPSKDFFTDVSCECRLLRPGRRAGIRPIIPPDSVRTLFPGSGFRVFRMFGPKRMFRPVIWHSLASGGGWGMRRKHASTRIGAMSTGYPSRRECRGTCPAGVRPYGRTQREGVAFFDRQPPGGTSAADPACRRSRRVSRMRDRDARSCRQTGSGILRA